MLCLNLGCGDDIKQGYVNLDIRKIKDTEQADVRVLPYEKESVDEIMAVDVYEHISFRESQQLLKHWVSLLKPGGKLIIRSPSIEVLARRILTSTCIEDIEASIAFIFGNQDYEQNFHHTSCHPELMTHYLRSAGIKGSIKCKTEGTNLVVEAYK